MSAIRIVIVAACALLLAGCLPVTSKTPVGSTAGLKADAALYGTWKGRAADEKKTQDGYLHFMAGKDGAMTAALVFARGDSDDDWMIFNVTTATLGKNHFLNAVVAFDKGAPADGSFKDAKIPLLYTVKGKTLTLYLMDENKAKALVKAGKLKGTIGQGDFGDVVLTEGAGELDAFMAKPEAADLFKPLLVMKKVE